jgi:flagellar basal-body rod protein FlgF
MCCYFQYFSDVLLSLRIVMEVVLSSLFDIAGAIISASERKLEITAQNAANLTTPGYRRILAFDALVVGSPSRNLLPESRDIIDQRRGGFTTTNLATDLALTSDGYFLMSDGERLVPVRSTSLRRDTQGRLTDGLGRILQQSGGGDIIVSSSAFQVQPDGVVIIDGRPEARIAVVAALDNLEPVPIDAGGRMSMFEELDTPAVRQGMLESANVDIGTEMVAIMAAQRSAESGARVMQLYDDLLGRAFSTFGRAGQ